MEFNHFKNLKKCNSEYKKILEKVINKSSELTDEDIGKVKIFKIIDMMYYYLSNNKELNINDIYEGVKRDYDNFVLLHPDNDNSTSSETDMSSPTSASDSSSENEESSESDEESDLESSDSSSVYSEKSDDVEYNKMITLTIMYHTKNKNNKELMIVRK